MINAEEKKPNPCHEQVTHDLSNKTGEPTNGQQDRSKPVTPVKEFDPPQEVRRLFQNGDTDREIEKDDRSAFNSRGSVEV